MEKFVQRKWVKWKSEIEAGGLELDESERRWKTNQIKGEEEGSGFARCFGIWFLCFFLFLEIILFINKNLFSWCSLYGWWQAGRMTKLPQLMTAFYN